MPETGGTGNAESHPPAIVVMGVSGSGKSTVGRLISESLGARFIEGDDFHTPENIAKMASGVPLTDDDRAPWLDSVAREMAKAAADGKPVVAACSALKRAYRDRLRTTSGLPLFLVHLHGARDMLAARLNYRERHFMPASMLDSQLAALEYPQADEEAVTLDVALRPAELARAAIDRATQPTVTGRDQN